MKQIAFASLLLLLLTAYTTSDYIDTERVHACVKTYIRVPNDASPYAKGVLKAIRQLVFYFLPDEVIDDPIKGVEIRFPIRANTSCGRFSATCQVISGTE